MRPEDALLAGRVLTPWAWHSLVAEDRVARHRTGRGLSLAEARSICQAGTSLTATQAEEPEDG